MLELAHKLAALKDTRVIAHSLTVNAITFVLESGAKLTMTEAQLLEAIAPAQSAASTPPLDDAPQAAQKPKKERKRG